ncbi:MAG TPA: extracellular solute-binding protein [Candidatus Mediterraneibacter quadrami]|uniref:Extracellular solute-binding protein n=1 Tax=Candidatus Mediterraneibacter quadrami TaxID=2838684 RepID=A0A9D2RH93_9FIRM|nr:extracellular solute-binding protein [Candidatus Mediterraneibacter quadrami]
MKKKLVSVLLSAAMVTAMLAGCGGGSDEAQQGAAAASGEKQTVALRMWGAEEDQALLQTLIDSFTEEYSDVADITVELGVESESTAKDTVLTDATAAADVYAFASDQLPDLVNAGALQSVDALDEALQAYTGKGVADIESANSADSVEAATFNDTLYAFPMTADNGYFLYYDSTVLSEEDVASWDTMLAKADEAGKKVAMTLASGWYNASFFYSAGFTTSLNEDGSTAMDWNGEADYSGVEVTQAMLNIASSPAFMPAADGDISNQIASGQLCAAVSGTWDAAAAQQAFGDGYAATKLPTFTVAGDQVQQASVSGYKLVGVNAHSENAGWAALLADWITNENAQQQRFEERQIGPSNLAVLESDEVQSNVALAALAAQNEFGVVQFAGQNYWDPAATFGQIIAQGELSADDTAGIQAALDTLVEGATAPIN